MVTKVFLIKTILWIGWLCWHLLPTHSSWPRWKFPFLQKEVEVRRTANGPDGVAGDGSVVKNPIPTPRRITHDTAPTLHCAAHIALNKVFSLWRACCSVRNMYNMSYHFSNAGCVDSTGKKAPTARNPRKFAFIICRRIFNKYYSLFSSSVI